MKLFSALFFLGLSQGIFLTDTLALTPAECNQGEGHCICIAFPGSAPVCTLVEQTALVLKEEKEKSPFLYQGVSYL